MLSQSDVMLLYTGNDKYFVLWRMNRNDIKDVCTSVRYEFIWSCCLRIGNYPDANCFPLSKEMIQLSLNFFLLFDPSEAIYSFVYCKILSIRDSSLTCSSLYHSNVRIALGRYIIHYLNNFHVFTVFVVTCSGLNWNDLSVVCLMR